MTLHSLSCFFLLLPVILTGEGLIWMLWTIERVVKIGVRVCVRVEERTKEGKRKKERKKEKVKMWFNWRNGDVKQRTDTCFRGRTTTDESNHQHGSDSFSSNNNRFEKNMCQLKNNQWRDIFEYNRMTHRTDGVPTARTRLSLEWHLVFRPSSSTK